MKVFTKTASRSLVWAGYLVILLEMIYMSTPFAVFFYSVYGAPLRFLSQGGSTAWMVQTILPHFTQTNSITITTLLYLGWPLMGIGFTVFVAGFCQVYWSKIRRKGAVLGGIYRFVRHPQYAGWAIFGIGMALLWSRMIVWITYVSMLFVYYLLALKEEKECLARYGESYRSYLKRTGRFLPRLGGMALREKRFLPPGRAERAAAIIVLYAMALSGTIGLGFMTREHTLSAISAIYGKDFAAVSLAPLGQEEIRAILDVSLKDHSVRDRLEQLAAAGAKQLIYIIPSEWGIPELGVEGEARGRHGFNPTNHGNPSAFDRRRYNVLISRANVSQDAEGRDILSKAAGQSPLLCVKVDLEEGRITALSHHPGRGRYGDLPVPLF
ncbi:MAG: isoprenylcysteine carboxylmethyltransferase family protein [Thermodesulfobacteriota bacterium]